METTATLFGGSWCLSVLVASGLVAVNNDSTYTPRVPVPRSPNFEGQVMAVDRVERLLRQAADALADADVSYAVVGGNAVAAWVMTVDDGAVRATKDVDILVRRDDLLAVGRALEPVGLMFVEVLGVVMFVDRRRPNPKTGVHLVFANERIRPDYAHPAPDVTSVVRTQSGLMVLELSALVMMKLQAFRDIDRVHIRDLLSVGLIDEPLIRKLPPDLRSRLEEIQKTPE